jgi:hypothetical protein
VRSSRRAPFAGGVWDHSLSALDAADLGPIENSSIGDSVKVRRVLI